MELMTLTTGFFAMIVIVLPSVFTNNSLASGVIIIFDDGMQLRKRAKKAFANGCRKKNKGMAKH